MEYKDVIKDFAKRTRKNLEKIEVLHKNDEDVYEITQLVNSCLGLLVFPQQNYIDDIPELPLNELELNGWPVPKITGDFKQVDNLRQLIRYLRNAIAHFNIKFVGDGDNNINLLKVWNNNRNKIIWEAELSLSDLRKLVYQFSDLIILNQI